MCSDISPADGWTERFRCCRAIVMAARHHKRTCDEPDCGVSMYDLKSSVAYLGSKLDAYEWAKLQHLVEQTDWT